MQDSGTELQACAAISMKSRQRVSWKASNERVVSAEVYITRKETSRIGHHASLESLQYYSHSQVSIKVTKKCTACICTVTQ